MARKDRVYREAAALWRELFREPPPKVDGAALLDLIMRRMPEITYDRLKTHHVRPSALVLPRR